MFQDVYRGKRVFVTGHTGFKGSWLASWLLDLGAQVAGYAVDIPTSPSHFETSGLQQRVNTYWGDIRDRAKLAAALDDFSPDCVFHLAAQPLVRRSYEDPVSTFETNTIGTLNVLETVRQRPTIGIAVIVTSDKCYRNVEWPWGYRETDPLGGEDPYSASKACAELVFYSYYHSFFARARATRVATGRAGNVVGGGDWAADRIVPDCVRRWSTGQPVHIRNPRATRPWQHVLEPLSGYLALGAALWQEDVRAVGSSYNFGPPSSLEQSVESLVDTLSQHWPGASWRITEQEGAAPEAQLLKLSCDKALAHLAWSAALTFEETVRLTREWYRHYYNDASGIGAVTRAQIQEYCALAQQRALRWTI